MSLLTAMQGAVAASGGGGPYAFQTNGFDQYLDFGSPFVPSSTIAGGFTLAVALPDTTLRYVFGGDTARNFLGCQVSTVIRFDSKNASGARYVQYGTPPSAGTRVAHIAPGLGRNLYFDGVAVSTAANSTSITTGGNLCFARLVSSYYALTARQFWTIDAAISATQLATLDALIAVNDDAGAAAYLYSISATAHYWPVGWPGDDATGGTGQIQDITPNAAHATPYNTTAANIVEV